MAVSVRNYKKESVRNAKAANNKSFFHETRNIYANA